MTATSPPNVLLVMADQLVPQLTGPYGCAAAKTPAMDHLAARGITFDAAYTPYPLCAPARAALMTGRYGSDLGCYDNAAVLSPDVPTFAHYLTNAGYETALSGKMHFIGPDQLHGFRHRLTTDVYPAGMDWVPAPDEHGEFPAGGHAHQYVPPNVGVRRWTKFLTYDEETQFRALEFLRERARGPQEEPFFLVASFHDPHDPFHVTQELWDLYANVDVPLPQLPEQLAPHLTQLDRWLNRAHGTGEVDLRDEANLRAMRRAYLGLVTYVDRKLGELLDVLEATGQLDDTVVIFTSDHGDMLGERGMVQKRCFYEWSARVPLLVRLPGDERARERVSTPVSLLDLCPMLLDLAGVPDAGRQQLDGTSLLDGLPADRILLGEYHVEKVLGPSLMARRGSIKLHYVHGHEERLYDVAADPGEWRDMSAEPAHTADLAELREAILDRFDPDAIHADGQASIRRRLIVQEAMMRNGTRWDFTPDFPGHAPRYVR